MIWYQLANDAGLTSVVPAGRIKPGVLPVNTPFPCVQVEEVDVNDRNTVSMADATRLLTSRVQVTVFSKTYSQKKSLIELVRKACPNTSGSINGVTVDCVLPQGAGPDLDDEEQQIYSQSRDFMVRWQATS